MFEKKYRVWPKPPKVCAVTHGCPADFQRGRGLSPTGLNLEGPEAWRKQAAFMAVARVLLGEGLTVEFEVTGRSMAPFLRDGDIVQAIPFSGKPSVGSIVMTEVKGHGVLIHRISKVGKVGEGRGTVVVCGDGLYGHDLEVPLERIEAEVVKIMREGKPIGIRPLKSRIWRSTRTFRHWLSRIRYTKRSLLKSRHP